VPKRCVPCLGLTVKAAIEQTHPELRAVLERIGNCDNDLGIVVCGGGRGGGGKREPSEYNLFISKCLKSKPIKGKGFGAAAPYMKECAGEWRKQHEK